MSGRYPDTLDRAQNCNTHITQFKIGANILMGFAVDDALVTGVGVQTQGFVALLTSECDDNEDT